MEIQILKMQLNDLSQIENCLIEQFDDFWSVSSLKQELENKANLNSHYFVAKGNDEIIGFVGIVVVLDEVNIMNIVTRKDKRNLGIASSLLEFIINFAKEKKYASITLEVNEKNLAAINLYKKYNFKQVGIRKNYYNHKDNAILMTLSL